MGNSSTIMQDPSGVAKQFVAAFYNAFDGDRSQLQNLFKDVSTVSFEGDNTTGGAAFLQKLNTMGIPSNQKHRIVTVDAQPSAAGSGALLVFVTGDFVGQKFQEVFQLVPANNSFYVHNDIFRVGTNNPFNVAGNDPSCVALCRQFMQHYYTAYDTDRSSLQSLYRESSMMTFEEESFKGVNAILTKISESPKVSHDGSSITLDAHQVNGNSLVLVFISGKLTAEGSLNPMGFAQTMLLAQENQQYFVANDIFRLNYG